LLDHLEDLFTGSDSQQDRRNIEEVTKTLASLKVYACISIFYLSYRVV